jgi:uncharacterized protein (TIGR03118 family)
MRISFGTIKSLSKNRPQREGRSPLVPRPPRRWCPAQKATVPDGSRKGSNRGVHRRPAGQRNTLSVERLESRCLLTAGYAATSLLSDIPGLANRTDTNLVNPWGFAETPEGQFRVSANGTGESLLLNARGNVLGRPVVIPTPSDSPSGAVAAPDGSAMNTTTDFVISHGGRSAPATFIISTEDGTIAGINPMVDRNEAVIGADLSDSGAVFKTLTLGADAHGNVIFASDFHNDQVDIFDKNFQLVGSFTDPKPHAGFAPFGVHNLNGTLFVTFAKQDDPNNAHDDVEGAGNGFIDEFTTDGAFIKRFATGSALEPGGLDALNSPFGATVAPADFGQFSSTPNNPVLLIGNFGSSQISAFNTKTGAYLGQLSDAQGHPLVLNGGIKESDMKGLWGIRFGNGHGGADANTLFFAAGINAEADGLFGKVTAVTSPNLHPHGGMNASVLPAAESTPMIGSGLSLGRSQDSPSANTDRDITLSTAAKSATIFGQTMAPVSKLSQVASRVRESAIDQLFGAFDIASGQKSGELDGG